LGSIDRRAAWSLPAGQVRVANVGTETMVVTGDKKDADLALLAELIRVEPADGRIEKIVVPATARTRRPAPNSKKPRCGARRGADHAPPTRHEILQAQREELLAALNSLAGHVRLPPRGSGLFR